MKRILKIGGLVLGILFIGGLVWGILTNEPLPSGKTGAEADDLAQKMLDALDYERYRNTRFLHWSYRGGANKYEWDRTKGICLVKWDNKVVYLNLSKPSQSKVKIDGSYIGTNEKNDLIQKAIDMFNNDSFWLVAPYKVFDKDTVRSLVNLENGDNALLVTYTSGGSTPGDSYLWLLDEKGVPYAFKMWVKIIPVGGIEASWDNWTKMESGAYLPKSHNLGPLTLSMGDIRGFNP